MWLIYNVLISKVIQLYIYFIYSFLYFFPLWFIMGFAGGSDGSEGYIYNSITALFIYFWQHWVFIAGHGLSLVAESGGNSLVSLSRLLISEAYLVGEHRF